MNKWPLDPVTHFIYLCVCGLALEEKKIVKGAFERPWICDLAGTRFPASLTLVLCGPQLKISVALKQSEQTLYFDILGMILLKMMRSAFSSNMRLRLFLFCVSFF